MYSFIHAFVSLRCRMVTHSVRHLCVVNCRMDCIESTARLIARYIHQPLPSLRPSMTQTLLSSSSSSSRWWFQHHVHLLAFRQVRGQQSTVIQLVWPALRHWSAATCQSLIRCWTTSTLQPRCTRLLPWREERQVWRCCSYFRSYIWYVYDNVKCFRCCCPRDDMLKFSCIKGYVKTAVCHSSC